MHEQGYVEKVMEDWLAENPHAVLPDEEARFLVIDQETAFQNLTDILAVDEQGNVIVIEVKRGQTPRDVIAQALEYASDVAEWDYTKLNARAMDYFAKRDAEFASLLDAMNETFQIEPGRLIETEINQRQRVFIIGEDIEPKIIRTAQWLLNRGIEIGCVSYTCYRTNEGELFLEFSNAGSIQAQSPKAPVSTVEHFPKAKRLQTFWRQLLDRAQAENRGYVSNKPVPKDQWLYSLAGIPNFRFNYMIPANGSTEVHFEIRGERKEENKSFFDRLFMDKDQIESRCGRALVWDRCDEKVASYVRWKTGDGLDLNQESGWSTFQVAMIDAMSRIVPVLEPYLDEMTA